MQMTDRQKKIWGIATVIGLVVFMGLLCWFVGRPMIRFVSEPEKFRLWVDEHGIWGRLAFIGMVIFQIIVAIIPGEPLEIGAGYAFGAVEGTILCLTGAVLGGAIVVLLVRRYGIKLVEVFFPREKIMSLVLEFWRSSPLTVEEMSRFWGSSSPAGTRQGPTGPKPSRDLDSTH